MAIRIGAPPVLARLRAHWYAVRSDYTIRFRAIADISSRGKAIVGQWRRTVIGGLASRLQSHPYHTARRKTRYARFVVCYEELVDVLCWAAKDGDHTDRDARYASIRHWMQLNYHKFRPQLRAHLGAWDGPLDPFEELFVPECIDDVINDPDAITHFMRTRAALEAYRDITEIA